jgi:hypothetical protein
MDSRKGPSVTTGWRLRTDTTAACDGPTSACDGPTSACVLISPPDSFSASMNVARTRAAHPLTRAAPD